jgi:cytidylate kinase
MKPNIAIDGPAGAGKSTVAKTLAEKLGYLYIDTGAMYRAVAYCALEKGVDLNSSKELGRLAESLEIELRYDRDNCLQVLCNGHDITNKLRTQAVSQTVSIVAKVPAVRFRLMEIQRKMAAKGGVIMDGRDIGSYVLPNAQLKLFVTASLEQRTMRRLKELQNQGYILDFEELKQEIKARDTIDASREMAPLKRVEDAVLVDTTNLSVDEAIDFILDIYKQRFGE